MRICTNCGKAYSRENVYCPYCGMTHHSLGRVCPRGHRNPRDAVFCAICGSQDLSQMASPPPIWQRLLTLVGILGGIALVIWLLCSAVIPHASHFLSALYIQSLNLLMPLIIILVLFFGFTLLLPKHMGKYIRKVLFSLVRNTFKVIINIVIYLWRMIASLTLSSLGRYNANSRRNRKYGNREY
jgi:RNA polymerase subunit RPABC4/transcription elongation factor Spt4